MNRLVVVSARELPTQWLQRALGAAFEVVACAPGEPGAVAAFAAAAQAPVILIDLPGAAGGALALVEGLAREPGLAATLVGIGEDDTPAVVLAAVRAGARDFLRIGSPADEVRDLVQRLAARHLARSAQRCRWWGVFGARADGDAVLCAAHLALALREAPGAARVLLLDMGVPQGDAPLLLGVPGNYTLLDALRGVARLDQTLIDTAIGRHRSGLYVLALPDDGFASTLTGGDLLELCQALDSHFDFVVVNLGGVAQRDLLKVILQRAEKSLMVVEPTVPSCRSNRTLVDHLREEHATLDRTGVVVDRCYRGMHASAPDVAHGLGLPLWAALPASGPARLQVRNRGDSMYALRPKDPYALAVRALVQELAGDVAGPGTPAGLGTRLRTALADWLNK